MKNNIFDKKKEDLYKVKKIPYKKDDLWQLKKLLKNHENIKKNKSKNLSSSRSYFIYDKKRYQQRVTFKMSNSSKLVNHKKYVNYYMQQKNKKDVTEKPTLFGSENYEENMVAKHFKCIISPENQSVNLEVLSNEFIKRVEMITGYKLYWQGAIHTNTSHRHSHICINGKDKNGKDVYFQPELIKRTMRETLSYVTTELVGQRTEKEINLAKANLFFAKRWTKLDEELLSYQDKISRNMIKPELEARLSFLESIGLAENFGKYYSLKKDWDNVLIATGRYNSFFDEYCKNNGNLKLYNGERVKGVVSKVISFDKDESWNDAIIVNTGKENIYVPIWQLKKSNLEGKVVEIAEGNKKLSRITDRDIKIKNDGFGY